MSSVRASRRSSASAACRKKGATLEELGRELGVSKERVRQLEQRAMEKLRSHIERRIEHRPEEPGDLMVEMVDA